MSPAEPARRAGPSTKMQKAKTWVEPRFEDISAVFPGLSSEQAAMRRRHSRHKGKPKRVSVRSVVRGHLLTHPCVDCGETDLDVLEFDHREPRKKKFLVGRAPTPLLARREIEKCDIRCANCHRRRHARERRAKCNT
jgi:hypothetical protein